MLDSSVSMASTTSGMLRRSRVGCRRILSGLVAAAATICFAQATAVAPAPAPALPTAVKPVPAFSLHESQRVSVLVVSTDDFSSPYLYSLYSSFESALRKRYSQRLTVYSENLQLTQFGSPAYRSRLHDWIAQKYADQDIQVIVAVGHAALGFLLESSPGLLPQVPIVIVATTASSLAALPSSDRVTGMTGQFRLADTVGLVKRLLPRTRHLALIGNQPEQDDYRPFFAVDLDALRSQIDFIDLRGLGFSAMMERVCRLPPDTALYFTRATIDAAGHLLSSQDVLERLVETATQPLFVDNATSVGAGPVGGIVAEPGMRGREVAELTQKLLAGIPAASLPVTLGKLTPVLDWRAMQRWHIDGKLAPTGADIRFYQPSLWERYRWQVAAVAVFIFLQFLTVLALLVARRKRETAIKESRQRLREIAHMNRNTTATVYSAAIAHELNQPLSAILSNTEAAAIFMQQDPPDLAQVREILGDIRRDDLRATELIRNMRTLLKKSNTDAQVFDLNGAAKDVIAFLSSEAKVRQVSLITALHRTPLLVLADPVQIQQVMINLIINSMDAMQGAGSGRKFVTLRTGLGATDEVELDVSDNGPGFQGSMKQVFESFFTTKAHGMGLGLSITAAIIDAHGGRIAAANAPSGGAVVSIRLPLAKETPQSLP